MKDPTLRPHATLTELERGLLDAAREDRIPSELKAHMAKALSGPVSSGALGDAAGKAVAPGAALGTKAWLWGSLVVVMCAGGYALMRQARSIQAVEQTPKPHTQLAVSARESDVQFKEGALTAHADAASANVAMTTADSDPRASVADVRDPTVESRTTNPVAASRAPTAPARASGPRSTIAPLASLQQELALLERARHALQTGAAADAQRLLELHAQQFAHATLEPEAEALRIELWAQRGERARAKRAAEHFLHRHANHPLAPRVTRIAAGL